ncbi:MAG: carboxylating nicotinate-nucleotide diphosphorylase [Gammaproteobacteria bacterium]
MTDSHEIAEIVARALAEDVGTGDLSAALIPADATANARVISREPAVICGMAWVEEVFRQLDARVTIAWKILEGQKVAADHEICALRGPTRALLTGERTALNFLQSLSATATAANRYVQAIEGTGAVILDTRKTLPGLRAAQKYAVARGGGRNHRMGLFDAILIKENHIAAAGSLQAVVRAARARHAHVRVEVEVETLAQIEDALAAGADMILLDNFSLKELRLAVKLTAHRAPLEASGGVNLETVRAIAETGVDYISVGALTKDIAAVDLSMRVEINEAST